MTKDYKIILFSFRGEDREALMEHQRKEVLDAIAANYMAIVATGGNCCRAPYGGPEDLAPVFAALEESRVQLFHLNTCMAPILNKPDPDYHTVRGADGQEIYIPIIRPPVEEVDGKKTCPFLRELAGVTDLEGLLDVVLMGIATDVPYVGEEKDYGAAIKKFVEFRKRLREQV